MDETYAEEEYLQLSGIQHFAFCRRQWALIHIEQQWVENPLTADGRIFHDRAHDEKQTEMRGDLLTVRGLRIKSAELGISGICDVVEFRASESGIHLQGYEGLWDVVPIEYKRGNCDFSRADSLQLCAEAICLEEMLCCKILFGYLFWGESHRREKVVFDEPLRKAVRESFAEMHQYLKRGCTPKVKTGKWCAKCSMKDICLPELTKTQSVKTYIRERLAE